MGLIDFKCENQSDEADRFLMCKSFAVVMRFWLSLGKTRKNSRDIHHSA
jgi:hypothetical protein